MKTSQDQSYWICDICAHLLGYKFPDGHCATMYETECGECGHKSVCTPVIDYIRPGVKRVEGLDD